MLTDTLIINKGAIKQYAIPLCNARYLQQGFARWRKKPGEVISGKHEAEERNKALIEAITELAAQGKPVNVSYDEMKEQYGEDIFGYMQPKRALDCIADQLQKENSIIIRTGKRVFREKVGKNGFSISYTPENNTSRQIHID